MPRSRLRCPALLGLLFAGLVAAGCGSGPASTAPVADLLEGFPLARTRVQTSVLDFAAEESRAVMVSGWSPIQQPERGAPFVINTGFSSELQIEVVAVRGLTFELDGRPLGPERSRTIEVEFNGVEVGSVVLERQAKRPVNVHVPREIVRFGDNRLVLRYPSEETRRRAVRIAWYGVRLVGRAAEEAPSALSDRGLLFVPSGTGVEYLLELPAGSSLEVDRWLFRGEEPGALDMILETDGAPAERVVTAADPEAPQRIDLGLDERTIVRLSLRSTDFDRASAGAGVGLGAPRIVAPPTELASEPAVSAPPSDTRPNVLIYMIDTLRADHLGCYGYSRETSPYIDAFASRSVLYERAVAQSSWTRASVASVLTGLWPEAHGAVGRRDRLMEEAVTLADLLSADGYQTAAIVTNPNVYRSFGFDQGFDRWVQFEDNFRNSKFVTRGAIEILDELDREEPFFLYLHTIDPHHPYIPPPDLRERFAPDSDALVARILEGRRKEVWLPEDAPGLRNLYDAEIADNDRNFGALVEALEERGLWDDTLIVLTSDHGEEFYDHGAWTHGKNLRAANLDVPLIVKYPGQTEGVRTAAPAQHVDVLPTILAHTGTEKPPFVDGLPLESAAASEPRRPLYSHLQLDGPRSVSLTEGRWKMVQKWNAGSQHVASRLLFDKLADPKEEVDLSGEWPVTTDYLGARIEAALLQVGYRLTATEAEIDPELEASLKALGYLQ